MSTREAVIQEILRLPEPLLGEVQRHLATLVDEKGKTATAWPPGYFEKTAGSFADEPLERPPQLPFERREEW